MFLAAAVQLRCTSDEDANWSQASTLITRAAGYGARLIVTPENTNYLGPHSEKVRRAEPVTGPTIDRFRELASRLGVQIVVGSFNEKAADGSKCHNTSVSIGPDGAILSTYRKIHLFDVDVSDDVRFKESDTVVPGTEPRLTDGPEGRIGMSICYDLRFPGLYTALADQGAQILTVPSAFTAHTGKDHWHPLLRARAIENQCWVIAPGQWGHHDDDGLRNSFGHSMIIDPWGQIVAMAPDGPGLAIAEIDLDRVATVRTGMPVASHRRI